ncbi:MAG: hypothetical protein IKU19_01025 [Clostridia bacterium]|nr:hypothetical protein [Clostridia bacterium]
MTSIKAGVIKDILNMIAKISDNLFAWLNGSDNKNVAVDNVKKVKENSKSDVFEFKVALKQNKDGSKVFNYPYRIILELPKFADVSDKKIDINELQKKYADIPCRITVYSGLEPNADSRSRDNVSGRDFWEVSMEMLFEMLDEDTKQAFGIKGSKRMKVTLQRVVSAKETAINLSAITADYALSEAYTDLDSLLSSDEFSDSITEEPVTLEIVDTGSDYDIEPAEFALSEAASYGISQLLCAAIQFQMDIQILRWYAAYNSELFGITGNLWWEANSWTDKLGLWYIEMTDSVFQVPQGCPSKPLTLDDSSDTDPVYEIGLALADTISVFLESLEGVYVDLPHDMQQELDSLIRSLKETRDMQLRRAM